MYTYGAKTCVQHLETSCRVAHWPRGLCTAVHIRQCRGHAVWTLVSATCSLHLAVSTLAVALVAWTVFPPCAYADISPGVGALVGREFAQSLGARLLMSALRIGKATRNLDSILFYIYENFEKIS